MEKIKKYISDFWSLLIPIFGSLIYFYVEPNASYSIFLLSFFLIGSVLAAVHHAEIIAHKLGEPFGTIILAVAITILEVSMIISLMLANPNGTIFLARDTVFAAVMLILNGVLGLSLLVGSVKFREQFFAKTSANSALVALIAILVFTLVLPNFTTSIQGPLYSKPQLIFVSVACLILYGAFLYVQTIRHKEYFQPRNQDKNVTLKESQSKLKILINAIILIISLGIVILIAKKLSLPIENFITKANLPKSLVGVLIAFIILLPEGISAIKAAQRDDVQTSINLALGSALASIGLTIPAVTIICTIYNLNVALGLDPKSMILLSLSVFVVMLSLSKGKTNILYGIVLITNFIAYIFTTIFP